MRFHVEHTTRYAYSQPATEAFSDLRLRPRETPRQKVDRHSTTVEPPVQLEAYTDYFGNHVETVAIPFRHQDLAVTSRCDVLTRASQDRLAGLQLTISETRQLTGTQRRELHDYLAPSRAVPVSAEVRRQAARLLPGDADFSSALRTLNHHIHSEFKYTPGVTDVGTTIEEFLRIREGVCQDFAHWMLCLCRNAGLPARYVSGYIETDPPPPTSSGEEGSLLIGATASHAWVEVWTPSGAWIGLDPTNDMLESERHIQVAIGRDYHDVPPVKGSFKGAQDQTLSVEVHVRRTA